MAGDARRKSNQADFRQLKPAIDRQYPRGHFVSIDDGLIIADAPDFEGVVTGIQKSGRDAKTVLIVQAGLDYPEKAAVFVRR